MYCHDIFALDAIIHSLFLFLPLSQRHTTVCVCDCLLFKVLVLFSWRDARMDFPASELQRNVWSCMHLQLASTWSLHFPFPSDQVLLAFVCLIILTFTASPSDAGDHDVHHLEWHSQSTIPRDRRATGKEMEKLSNNRAEQQVPSLKLLNSTFPKKTLWARWRMNVYFLLLTECPWKDLNLRLNTNSTVKTTIYCVTTD